MINFQKQVPSVYPNASRDFQYMSWLANIVLNAVKHNVDDLYNLPIVSNTPKLTELLAMTLGFEIKRNYDEKQLTALVAILPSVLRYKGTEKAVLMAAKALVKATGSLGEAYVEVDGSEIKVTLPRDIADITLFLDLLDYILPAGMTYRVIRDNKRTKNIDDIKVMYNDSVRLLLTDDLAFLDNLGAIVPSIGLSNMFETGLAQDFDTAYTKENSDKPNSGLLNNTIIPVLADSHIIVDDDEQTTVELCGLDPNDNTRHVKLCADNGDKYVVLKAKRSIQEL